MQTLHDAHHRSTEVDGFLIHSVTVGSGPNLVLVAGWPQWWWTWRHVMAELQEHFTVHAVDLRGQGASHAPRTGYDGVSVAAELHRWTEVVQLSQFTLIGHDVGTWVAFTYACSYPESLTGLVLCDALIPGLSAGIPPAGRPSDDTNVKQFQFSFNRLPELPELLVAGHERAFMAWLFQHKSKHPERIDKEVVDAFADALKSPDYLRAGFEYYRSLPMSDKQNAELAKRGLPMPVLTIGAGASVGRGLYQQLKPIAANIEDATLDDCGHYLSEEAPEALVAALEPFLLRCSRTVRSDTSDHRRPG